MRTWRRYAEAAVHADVTSELGDVTPRAWRGAFNRLLQYVQQRVQRQFSREWLSESTRIESQSVFTVEIQVSSKSVLASAVLWGLVAAVLWGLVAAVLWGLVAAVLWGLVSNEIL